MTNKTKKPMVRFTMLDGDRWFSAADLARLFDVTNASIWIKPLGNTERRTLSVQTAGTTIYVHVINLVGLLKLVFASKAPRGRALREKITADDIQSWDPCRLLPGCTLVDWDSIPTQFRPKLPSTNTASAAVA